MISFLFVSFLQIGMSPRTKLQKLCRGLEIWLIDRSTLGKKLLRRKRQSTTNRRRYRGQTQTQYIAFNNGGSNRTGTAEALATPDTSRATVSK